MGQTTLFYGYGLNYSADFPTWEVTAMACQMGGILWKNLKRVNGHRDKEATPTQKPRLLPTTYCIQMGQKEPSPLTGRGKDGSHSN